MTTKIEDAREATDIAYRLQSKALWNAFTGAQQAAHTLDRVQVGTCPEIDEAREHIAAATASLIQANERLKGLFARMGWR